MDIDGRRSSETSVDSYQWTRRHIPEDFVFSENFGVVLLKPFF
jgi:hypothetical protein